MYVPLAVNDSVTDKYIFHSPAARILYSRDFHGMERFFYHRKRKKIHRSIERQVCLNEIDLVHAHSLFSAGGVAHSIKEKTEIGYIVAVRNSDINYFFRYGVHLRLFGVAILMGASRIIFISPAHRDTLIDRYIPKELTESVLERTVVIPNGVNDYWLHHKFARGESKLFDAIKLIYVGEITKNKNIVAAIKATRLLCAKGFQASLSIVGDGPEMRRIKRVAHRHRDLIRVHGPIESKEELMRLFRASDIFIMVSNAETFGLVYIEAMSQGLPVIYSKGQGIDGYFSDGAVGYGCAPSDVEGVADAVRRLALDYGAISSNCSKYVDYFSWDRIALIYEDMYGSLKASNERLCCNN
jgi:L-malate glycosyltransferase